MSKLTVEVERRPNGLLFKRSDGETFTLVQAESGNPALCRGEDTAMPSCCELAEYDSSVKNMMDRIMSRVLAWPDEPL